MAGGGIKGGQVYGETDEIGWGIAEDPVHVNDLHATMLHLFGLDHLKLTYRFQGRDFRLTDVAGQGDQAVDRLDRELLEPGYQPLRNHALHDGDIFLVVFAEHLALFMGEREKVEPVHRQAQGQSHHAIEDHLVNACSRSSMPSPVLIEMKTASGWRFCSS